MNFIDFFYPVLIIIMLTAIFILGYRYKGIHDRMEEMEEALQDVIYRKQRLYLRCKKTDETLALTRLINQLLDLYLDEKTARMQEWAAKRRLIANFNRFITEPLHSAAEHLNIATADAKTRGTHMKTAMEDMDEVQKRAAQMTLLLQWETDTSPFPFQSTDVCQLVSQIASEAEPRLKQHHFTVDIRIPQKKYMARINPEGVGKLLHSLIENAATHGKSGRYIGIQVHPDEEYENALAVEIIDHGKGMNPAHLNAIFSPLEEEDQESPSDASKDEKDSSLKMEGSGSKWNVSGLGLAMACLLAKKSGGGLGGASKPGQTVFKLLLPME